MKRIVWKNPDGSIEISTPMWPMLEGETEDQYLDRVAARTRIERLAAGFMDKNTVEAGRITKEEHDALDHSRRADWRWDGARKSVVVADVQGL